LHLYRAVLILNDDIEILSEISGIVARGGTKVLLYPNPVPRQSNIQVLLESMDVGDLYFYNSEGQLVIESKVRNGSEILLQDIASGLYFFKIIMFGQEFFTGSLVVE
ncbi:MAG: T9SS type A sorting domain-containing protein, partial [Saprospiraceae bacterium]|nr:T9SS type A sorting domain-containing protein [Saprospiraceae bacterium]